MSFQDRFRIDTIYAYKEFKDFLGISDEQIPIFIFFLIMLIVSQIMGAKSNKPIVNTMSIMIFVVIIVYWKFFT